ncbi:MAG TPA: hypothetical protein VMU89_13540 [Thermomicrobiaceae bacterium]|nr:hypothetical protein [Thermomicrobiaceae bacterium]
MSGATIDSVRNGGWRVRVDLSERERVALECAERMTATPPAVDDAFFASLAGLFEAAEIVEMAAVCAFENYRARLNVALGVEGHGFSTGEARRPEERGQPD